MPEPVRCAVVGLGWLGSIRASLLAGHHLARLLVCCDVRPEAAAGCPEGVRFTGDLEDTLSEPGLEAVFVCTPDRAHRSPVVRALERGLHVFCEKPLAASAEDMDAMVEAERASGCRLVVGHSLRLDQRFRALKERAASGELGRAVHVYTRRNWPLAEGRRQSRQTTIPLYLSVHDFDVMQWIVGSPIERVYGEAAVLDELGLDGAASIAATVRFEDGTVGVHEVSWALPDGAGLALGDRMFAFVGTRGTAYLEGRDDGLVIYGGGEPVSPENPEDFVTKGTVEYPDARGGVLGIPSGQYPFEVEHFLLGIRDGRPPALTSEEARSAALVALALERSLATGAPVTVARADQ